MREASAHAAFARVVSKLDGSAISSRSTLLLMRLPVAAARHKLEATRRADLTRPAELARILADNFEDG